MDPNALLAQFRQSLREWQRAALADDDVAAYEALLEVACCAVDLDMWLSRGGYVPNAWKVISLAYYQKER